MDPRERFSATVERYARYRPDYPDALFGWIAARVVGRRAVDLGAGTGILSRQLAERGWDVIGVEPNAPMRERAVAAGGAAYVAGTAEATGLPSGSADLVIGAQAFHWFDLDRALPEIARIRAPHSDTGGAPTGSTAAAVWNVRAGTGFAAAYEHTLVRWSGEYAAIPKPDPTLAALRERLPDAVEVVFRHGQDLDLDGVLGRAWSSSYVVHGVTDRAGFDGALTAAFEAHARDGRVELAYETRVLAW